MGAEGHDAEDAEPLAKFLVNVGEAGRGMNRAELKAMLAGKAPGLDTLTPTQRAIADEALRDLDLSLVEIPDASLGPDFAYLANAIRVDLATSPTATLARLDSLRKRLLRTGGARLFLASSDEMRQALAPKIESFAARLRPPRSPPSGTGRMRWSTRACACASATRRRFMWACTRPTNRAA
jgi:hypothetical protein